MTTSAELHQLAREQFVGVRASMRMEVVAIGCAERDTWQVVPNMAVSGTAFHVAGDDVRVAVLALLALDVGLQQVDLWHSHYVYAEPSRADLDNFPQWARHGYLFHTPSERTIPYTRSGVISSHVGTESSTYTKRGSF